MLSEKEFYAKVNSFNDVLKGKFATIILNSEEPFMFEMDEIKDLENDENLVKEKLDSFLEIYLHFDTCQTNARSKHFDYNLVYKDEFVPIICKKWIKSHGFLLKKFFSINKSKGAYEEIVSFFFGNVNIFNNTINSFVVRLSHEHKTKSYDVMFKKIKESLEISYKKYRDTKNELEIPKESGDHIQKYFNGVFDHSTLKRIRSNYSKYKKYIMDDFDLMTKHYLVCYYELIEFENLLKQFTAYIKEEICQNDESLTIEFLDDAYKYCKLSYLLKAENRYSRENVIKGMNISMKDLILIENFLNTSSPETKIEDNIIENVDLKKAEDEKNTDNTLDDLKDILNQKLMIIYKRCKIEMTPEDFKEKFKIRKKDFSQSDLDKFTFEEFKKIYLRLRKKELGGKKNGND